MIRLKIYFIIFTTMKISVYCIGVLTLFEIKLLRNSEDMSSRDEIVTYIGPIKLVVAPSPSNSLLAVPRQ